jgi:hypothetical protein
LAEIVRLYKKNSYGGYLQQLIETEI